MPEDKNKPAVAALIADWRRLVDNTQWTKGLTIFRCVAAGLTLRQFAESVTGVSEMHAKRMYDVHERFFAVRLNYPTLGWDHFYQALHWEDAEEWLAAAVEGDWSPAKMQTRRWEAQRPVAE